MHTSGYTNLRPRVIISACLTGEPVRYDGTDRNQVELRRSMQNIIELIPLCPEAGAGMGVPRPPVQRVASDEAGPVRIIGRDHPSLDVTRVLQHYSEAAVAQLLHVPYLCGWILKSRSPSCGLGSSPLYHPDGRLLGTGDGVLAALVRQRAPWLAMREETELTSPWQRQQFIRLCQGVAAVLYSDHSLQEVDRQHQAWWTAWRPEARQELLKALAQEDRRQYCTILVREMSRLHDYDRDESEEKK